jgi:hemolysin-activating ACP:hemolysin acyltransferase
MFSPTYMKDLNQQYTGVSVRLNTIKQRTDEIIDFFGRFARFQHLSYEELYQMISPCVRQEQYKIFRRQQRITGFANWAFVNDRVLDRYLGTGRLGTLDWNSGMKMLWVEVVTEGEMDHMMSWMKNYSVNLLGENVRIYWIRSQGDNIRKQMKIRTKRNWRWAV